MAACGMSFAPATGFLIQIHHGYAADCGGFRLSIETDSQGWRADVPLPAGWPAAVLAHRCSLQAAKAAAAEIAIFRASGLLRTKRPELLARQLPLGRVLVGCRLYPGRGMCSQRAVDLVDRVVDVRREAQPFGFAGSSHGDADPVALPKRVVGALGRHVAQAELDHAARKRGLDVRLQLDIREDSSTAFWHAWRVRECEPPPPACRSASRNPGPIRAPPRADRRAARRPRTCARLSDSSAHPAVTMEGQNCGIRSRADVEQAGLQRSHQPFVGAGGIGIAADLLQVHVERAEGLRAVQVHPDAAFPRQRRDLARRILNARGAGQVRDRDYLGSRA